MMIESKESHNSCARSNRKIWTLGEIVEYFRIKNWDKYQDEKKSENGQLPWIRLYTHCLDDPKTSQMSAYQFAIWVKLLLIARRLDNRLPLDPRWIAARCDFFRSKRRVDLAFLWDLGLVEAAKPLGEREERERERRGEGYSKQPSGKTFQKTPFKTPAQVRQENNLRVAQGFLEEPQ